MDYKIIQIIPNNKEDLYAYYEDDGSTLLSPVVCFALIEWGNGKRAVQAMDISYDGGIGFPNDATNFIKIK